MTQPGNDGRQVNIEKVIDRLTQALSSATQQTIVQSVMIDELTTENSELRAKLAEWNDVEPTSPPAPVESASADSE